MPRSVSCRIAELCVAASNDGGGAQLCCVSVGFDVERIAAYIVCRAVEACKVPSPNACLSCVILPEGTGDDVLLQVAKVLSAILSSESNDGIWTEAVNVHAVLEGSTTRQRCSFYQSGGVIVLCSRSLCADLLHRRIARELIGCVVALLRRQRVDGIAHTMGFCIEILLRGGGPLLLPAHQKHPPIVLLSDDPLFVRYAIQHPRIRQKTFLSQLRVDNVLLFPRFRLDIMRHFERVASQRPLMVNRITVGMTKNVSAIDDLLCKVIKEVVAELHGISQRSSHSVDGGDGGAAPSYIGQANGQTWRRGAPSTRNDIGDNDDSYSRFHSLLQCHPLERRSKGQSNGTPPGYTRKPWVSSSDQPAINFSGITDESALNNDDRSLDDDLYYAVRANGGDWPYSKLCKSLIDLRKLRRIVRRDSPYACLLALGDLLSERAQRFSGPSVSAGWSTVQPHEAPWTLSQHFTSIMKLFVYRIGEVKVVNNSPPRSDACSPISFIGKNAASLRDRGEDSGSAVTFVDVDGDSGSDAATDTGVDGEDSDEDVVLLSYTRPRRALAPRADEVDPRMELTCRIVMNWCRNTDRRLASAVSVASPEGQQVSKPRLSMVVVFGRAAFRRYTCRLAHSLSDFQALEFDCFLASYRQRHGEKEWHPTPSSNHDISDAARLRTWFFPHKMEEVDAEGDGDKVSEGSSSDDENQRTLDDRTAPSTTSGTLLSHNFYAPAVPRGSESAGIQASAVSSPNFSGNSRGRGSQEESLHCLIMRQGRAPTGVYRSQGGTMSENGQVNAPVSSAEDGLVTGALKLECVRDNVARLSFRSSEVGSSSPPLLYVAVVNGAALCVSSLVELITGSHAAFTLNGGGDTKGNATPVGLLRVCQIIVAEQQLRFMRMLEMAQDLLSPVFMKNLRVQVLVEQQSVTASAVSSSQTVDDNGTKDPALVEEQEAFAALAHAKATLPEIAIANRDSIRAVEECLEFGALCEGRSRPGRRAYQRSLPGFTGDAGFNCCASSKDNRSAPLVVVDEREFRSRLPYELYCLGIDLVPLTLLNGDYILSPTYALERKSVPDFIQSLCSGRVHAQLSRLSRYYQHPMVLIEFDRSTPFRLSRGVGAAVGEHSESNLFYRIAKLFISFPRVHVIWSGDASQTALFIHSMKRSCASESVDPSAPQLTSANTDHQCQTGAGEYTHQAARILSFFPGITLNNINRVMAVCGSLGGLGTIGEEALAKEMGATAARELYAFIHKKSLPSG